MLGKFTWSFGEYFHIEADNGVNYEWSDPDYDGDDGVKVAPSHMKWCKKRGIPYGREKGTHDVDLYTNGAFSRAGML